MNTRMRKSIVWTPLAVMLLFGLVACETTPVQQGAVVGGALGAGAGAIIGNQSHGRSGEGALIGAATGALAGALVGDQVQKKRENSYRPLNTEQAQPVPAPAPTAERGHYENRVVKRPNGETYEERVWVPDR